MALCQTNASIDERRSGISYAEKELLRTVVAHHKKISMRVDRQVITRHRAALRTSCQSYMAKLVPHGDEKFPNLNADTLIIELGNSPKIYHLGMMRMIVKGLRWARWIEEEFDIPTVVLFIFTDMISPGVISEARWLRYYVKGKLPTKPFRYGIPSKYKNVPCRYTPAPSQNDLNFLRDRLLDQVDHNLMYMRELDWQTALNSTELRERILTQINSLVYDDLSTIDFALWTLRFHWNTLEKMCGYAPKLLIFPTSEFSKTFPEFVSAYLQHLPSINTLQGRPSAELPIWLYCPECHCRCARTTRRSGNSSVLRTQCLTCRKTFDGELSQFDSSPDVVFRQGIFGKLAISLRIVGNIHSYADYADRVSKEILNAPSPIRFCLGGQPVFVGIGEPPGGCTRTSMLRALFECTESDLGQQLACSPLDGSVYIQSPHILRSN